MCLIIAKPVGVEFPSDFLEICRKAAECNPDGMGFAIPEGVYKGFNIKWKDFHETMLQMIGKDDPAIIHWRYSTSGFDDSDNCHPFQIEDGTMFAHNGNIAYHCPPAAGKSDTAVLASSVKNVYQLYYRCLQLTTSSNKFAILTPKELGSEIILVGERHGTWENGLWFSNLMWKVGRQRYTYNDYGVGCHTTNLTNYQGSVQDKIDALIKKHGLRTVVDCLDKYCKNLEVANAYVD
jgi:predicted glutamine amidotransferase